MKSSPAGCTSSWMPFRPSSTMSVRRFMRRLWLCARSWMSPHVSGMSDDGEDEVMSETVSETRSESWVTELQTRWSSLSASARLATFKDLPRAEAEDFFSDLSPPEQSELLLGLPVDERRGRMRLLAPRGSADAVPRAAAPERVRL